MTSAHPIFQIIFLSLIFALSSHSQMIVTDYTPFQALPTTPLPAVKNSGMFLWPLTGSVELYEVGSLMNISWSSQFSRSNLWLVPNFDWTGTVPLLASTSSRNFEWTVQCLGDCEVPWLVRATDAEGDAEAQTSGGFVSAEFWIMPAGGNKTSASNGKTTTTLIKSTVTISPPRLTITLNSTSAIAVQTLITPIATLTVPASSSNVPTTSPTTSRTTHDVTSSTASMQQIGNAIKDVEAVVGVAVAAVMGALIGWCL